MEKIIYRKTLDVHKNGVQFLLQGFETADNMSRVIEISLMASGDAIDFPLEDVVVMMYVTTENAKEPSIHPCTIKDNKVVYEVLPITEEGITTMQMKIIEADKYGAKSVLASPKFAVEVTNSNTNDDGEELKASFTAIEEFIAKAETAYGNRLERIELDSECLFKAYYADGTYYETDILKKLFLNGNVLLSESFAHGGTGVRAGEDTDNSKYYSNVAKSEAINAKSIMEDSEDILREVKLHGVYTAFSIDFESGEAVYVSPTFKFKLNTESGELEASGQNYTFNDDAGKFVEEWLIANGVVLTDLQTLADDVEELKETTRRHTNEIAELQNRVTPIEKGGTGATTVEEAIVNLGIDKYQKPWSVESPLVPITRGVGSLACHAEVAAPVKEESLELYMINSGQIYLVYKHIFLKSRYVCTDRADVSVYINDTLVNKRDFSELGKTFEPTSTNLEQDSILLDVKKGDIVKLLCNIELRKDNMGGGGDMDIDLNVSDISLLANVETPYTYINFPMAPSDTITVEDILNALTGGDN